VAPTTAVPRVATATVDSPPEPLPESDRSLWPLGEGILFLNHGSFGSPRREILARQAWWRDVIEADPIEHLGRRCREHLAPAREQVASLVGGRPECLGFTTNATEGVNAVLRSIAWRRGDRIVTTTHVYHAVRQSLRRIAGEFGVEVVEVEIPLPIRAAAEVVERIDPLLRPPTRLLLVDHVTSPTAVVFPVQALVDLARERGIDTLVDAAHAPGMVEVDLATLRPAYFAANLHKWVGAPKGAAFLHVDAAHRAQTHPLVTSHFLGEGLAAEFDWQGTRDITPWVCAADAVAAGRRIGWARIRAHNATLAAFGEAVLRERLGVAALLPEDRSMHGSIASVALPAELRTRFGRVEALQACLRRRFSIEVPIVEWQEWWLVRISAAPYNRPHEYEQLADALDALRRGR
jgi:isopenicillin-N epimerase